ncbi:uncharacterized protein LOC6565751 isoform X4 [Drosophila grimshawi]|uniref:uncharacterized protein LOC6565751 isoform X4 n=1 Tax=Drosophila grimshawi TaxID=7222 RepID=UPI000C86F59E|nr:uncharacterized protein LOC6565751 isoform X4 [Drosophila grimshawi]
MWRLQLFLILSTCFLIPLEAKPTTITRLTHTTTTAATATTATTTATATRQSNHIGRLAAKDLADLLMASMQARGIKLTSKQELTVKSLRDMESMELQDGVVLMQLGMDFIIDVLIGSNANASCDRVIKDIKNSKDKNSLTLSLKSFMALCTFNNIECSQKHVEQMIQSTTVSKQSDTGILGSRNTRTALEQAAKTPNIRGDRDAITNFLQARTLPELKAILSTLLQVCGASSLETQNIVQNMIEMGPKDSGKKNGISLLQINAFSTLINSLMDSLTSIAHGNKSGFCAATPDSWIVRLINMGVAKVIIMSLMTALDRSLPPSPNSLILITEKGNAMANLVDADVPLSKGAPTSKRASGLLPNIGNLGGNTITSGPKNIIDGNNNVVTQLVSADVPVAADVSALTNTFGSVEGANAIGGVGGVGNSVLPSGSSRSQNIANNLGNTINMGSKNAVLGNNNKILSLVDAAVPVGLGVGLLNNVVGAVTGGGGSANDIQVVDRHGNLLMKIKDDNASGSVGNDLSQTINRGPKQVVMGDGNTVLKLVNLDVNALANINLANAIRGSSGACNGIANKFGNELNTGPDSVIEGNQNTVVTLLNLDLSLLAGVSALNTVIGEVGNDCPEPTTPEPPTDEPPTDEPPTDEPPTRYPPTPTPPTPPTPTPPTPTPPTPTPPNPNKCYRRYCRKWRTRPNYMCRHKCGGPFVYRP